MISSQVKNKITRLTPDHWKNIRRCLDQLNVLICQDPSLVYFDLEFNSPVDKNSGQIPVISILVAQKESNNLKHLILDFSKYLVFEIERFNEKNPFQVKIDELLKKKLTQKHKMKNQTEPAQNCTSESSNDSNQLNYSKQKDRSKKPDKPLLSFPLPLMKIAKSYQKYQTNGTITGILGFLRFQDKKISYVIGPLFRIKYQSGSVKTNAETENDFQLWQTNDKSRFVGLEIANNELTNTVLALSLPEAYPVLKEFLYQEIVNSDLSSEKNLKSFAGEISSYFLGAKGSLMTLSKKLINNWALLKDKLADKVKPYALKLKSKFNFKFRRTTHSLPYSYQPELKFFTIILVLSLFPFSIFSFFSNYQTKINNNHHVKLNQLNRQLSFYRQIMDLENQRNRSLDKILKIINYYNPDLHPATKIKVANEIYEMCIKYENLNIELVCATITHESARTWDPKIVSPAKAIGLMQILPITGKFLAKQEGYEFNNIEDILYDPIINIRLGCRYLSYLIEAYDVHGGLAAYNCGERWAEKWISSGQASGILPTETVNYVPAILKIYQEYCQMRI